MTIIVILVMVISAFVGLYSIIESSESEDVEKFIDPAELEFNNFIAKYQRSYTSFDEFEFRRQVFKKNFDYINEFNAKSHSWSLEINHFADMSDTELASMSTVTPFPEQNEQRFKKLIKSNLKKSVRKQYTDSSSDEDKWRDIDWRFPKNKYILESKNQGII